LRPRRLAANAPDQSAVDPRPSPSAVAGKFGGPSIKRHHEDEQLIGSTQLELHSSNCTVYPVECENVTPNAPEPAEIASDLRYIVGQIARRTRERDIVTLPTRLAETLSYLDREGPMTTSELAERHSVRQQSMAAKLAELDAHGYIERRPHPTDRRKILVAISQDGRDRLNDDRRRRISWLAEAITDRLNSREQRVLANSLSLLDRLIEA
jgi:DNA-binding MarR family transcriptional regulator